MSQPFSINARSCILIDDANPTEDLLSNYPYVIPVYQRPYSWGDIEIRRLFSSIFNSYLNEREPYFLGTIQLMRKEKIDEQPYWEIVDGQQRLTSLLLFFNVLRHDYPQLQLPASIEKLDWLRTQVSKGQQQILLTESLAVPSLPMTEEDAPLNPYLRNCAVLHTLLLQYTEHGEDAHRLVVDDAFLTYILTQLYSVVIVTEAGLAKTLDIFNTINTAGMDLNGGDVFKIQLYEYLTRKLGMDDSVFDEIDELYANVDARNRAVGYTLTDVLEILGIYKFMLIERLEANRALHDMATDTFYERLFACLLLGEKHLHFNSEWLPRAITHDTLVELNRLVDMRAVWELDLQISTRHKVWHDFLCRNTRYGWRYWTLDIIYLFQFWEGKPADAQLFEEWNELLVRYYTVKTIEYKKAVYHARTFTHDVVRALLQEKSPVRSIQLLQQELANYNASWFKEYHLLGNVFDNRHKRDAICWLLAMMTEPDWNEATVRQKFFGAAYDIEHIHPRNPDEASPLDDLWEEDINTLGNLILLESGLNRSSLVSNYSFAHKWSGYRGGDEHTGSKLLQVQLLCDEHAVDKNWTLEKCKARTHSEADRLMAFLFDGCAHPSEN